MIPVPNIPKDFEVVLPERCVEPVISEALARTMANGGLKRKSNRTKLSKRPPLELDRIGYGGEKIVALGTGGIPIIREGRLNARNGQDLSDIWIGGKRFDVKTSNYWAASLMVSESKWNFPSDGYCLVTSSFRAGDDGYLSVHGGQIFFIRGFIMFDAVKKINRVTYETSNEDEIIAHYTVLQSELLTLHEALSIPAEAKREEPPIIKLTSRPIAIVAPQQLGLTFASAMKMKGIGR